MWNLLDIANTVSDLGNGHHRSPAPRLMQIDLTEPGLALRLIEELLEAQTLQGCRIVLDYLDSRREFLTEVLLYPTYLTPQFAHMHRNTGRTGKIS